MNATTTRAEKIEANYAAMRIEWDAAHEEHMLLSPSGRVETRGTLDECLEWARELAIIDADLSK